MREATKEELASIERYIDSISEQMIPMNLIEAIKAEIEDLEPTINHDFEGFYNCQHNVLRIIDRYINRKEQE